MTFFKGSKKIANRHGLPPSKAPPENRFAENERFGSYRADSTGPNSSANKSVQRHMNDTIIYYYVLYAGQPQCGRTVRSPISTYFLEISVHINYFYPASFRDKSLRQPEVRCPYLFRDAR